MAVSYVLNFRETRACISFMKLWNLIELLSVRNYERNDVFLSFFFLISFRLLDKYELTFSPVAWKVVSRVVICWFPCSVYYDNGGQDMTLNSLFFTTLSAVMKRCKSI